MDEPAADSFLGKTTDAAATGKTLREQFRASGTYHLPSMQDDQGGFAELYKAGSIGRVHLQRQGGETMSP